MSLSKTTEDWGKFTRETWLRGEQKSISKPWKKVERKKKEKEKKEEGGSELRGFWWWKAAAFQEYHC